MSTATYVKGTLLTCSHGHCGCRLVVEQECHCESDASATYTCACGAPMTVVQQD
jgi:hypothetical protein